MVSSVILALALALAAPPASAANALDARIRDSYAAAQGLQGALDGAWSLCDSAGRPLYNFEIVDPPASPPRIEAAWRAPLGRGGESGVAEVTAPSRASLRIAFVAAAGPVRIDLRPSRAGSWSGRLTQGGGGVRVVLKRDRC